MTEFDRILSQYRSSALAQRGKGSYFEKLIRRYLLAEPVYKNRIETVWLWTDFPYRADFGGKDTGIDLVARTFSGEYWAVQCKLYAENAYISMPDVSTFLAASGKSFNAEDGKKTFSERLFVSTTNKWNSQAEMAIQNQNPPVTRISLSMLQNSCEYLDWQALDSGTSQPQSKYGGADSLGISGSDSVMEETAGSFAGIKAAKAKKTLRPHQQDAVSAVLQHFEQADRAKLIMACGTGKTFTSLKIAERLTNNSGLVLFLVPSIALLGQTLREWCSNSEKEIFPICVCSDSTVGRNGKKTDNDDISIVNLPMPASTNTDSIYRELKQSFNTRDRHGMTVVFSTYQSIDVVMQAQKAINSKNPGSFDFDIIICDEAHRTTGVILSNKEESSFTKAHDNNNIRAKKRLYMTATPRIYAESAKQKVKDTDCLLCSMDDEAIYGKEAYRIGFGAAVNQNLLADYKVLVLTVKEEEIPAIMRHSLPGSGDKEIPADDASRLIGCINALSKRVLEADKTFNDDPSPMRRAVAFCPKIADSKYITELFNVSAKDYYRTLPGEEREKLVDIESKHIDGAMGAAQRDLLLDWLKGDGGQSDGNSQCRILTNVRCLSEGVDVPSLDAVMFLSAKNSQIDVVQSVGRVMRTAPGKKYGYIIIPIMIPQGIKPEDALDDNKNYAVVWTVLNALRAHDDRFDAEINKIELNKNKGGRINVIGVSDGNNGEYGGGNDGESPVQINLPYDMDELKNVIYAKMVQKVGNKRYWVQWAEDVAHIAERYIAKINSLIAQPGRHQTEFNRFLKGLRRNINPSVRQEDAVQMLAQHLITRPVFEALFSNYSFAENNAVSKSLQKIINLLEEKSLQSDKETLSRFYQSVRERAEGIDNAEGRQKIITELYDKFFRTAFPKTTEKLGIVYTPIEVVDFICSSVAEVLKKEFGRTISDENVHILDPFTGTGTFIVRLIQTGLINPQALGRKYESELHANEIVLLAYYIASVNIENTYHSVMG
ncbi:MAG: DEAD/DEAH box helicase family protein, partial [Elusimicrobiales bacterium]|nr:DEAD/DEAH box helicase family protein [Elusimicrobiales bacterium]